MPSFVRPSDSGERVMRAARWHGRQDVRVEEVPTPQAAPGQMLLAVERAGICGTDVEEYLEGPLHVPVGAPHPLSGRSAPLTLGHEVVGRVVDCPGGEVPVGTRVVPDVMPACGHCWWCQRHEPGLCPQLAVLGLQADGGLAEHLVVDARRYVPVPDALPVEVAGFAEPTAVAVRALRKLGDLAGTRVAVVGLGTIGNLIVQALMGTAAVAVAGVDPVLSRRELATAAGAGQAVVPEEASELFADRYGPDLVLECAGTERSLAAAVGLARPGGTVVLVGTGHREMTLPVRDVVLQEKRLLGTAGHVWDVDVAAAVALLERGTIDTGPLLSRTIALEDVVEEGFAALRRDQDLLKIHVDPQGRGHDPRGS